MNLRDALGKSVREYAKMEFEDLIEAREDAVAFKKKVVDRIESIKTETLATGEPAPRSEWVKLQSARHSCALLVERIQGALSIHKYRRVAEADVERRSWCRTFVEVAKENLPADFERLSDLVDAAIIEASK